MTDKCGTALAVVRSKNYKKKKYQYRASQIGRVIISKRNKAATAEQSIMNTRIPVDHAYQQRSPIFPASGTGEGNSLNAINLLRQLHRTKLDCAQFLIQKMFEVVNGYQPGLQVRRSEKYL